MLNLFSRHNGIFVFFSSTRGLVQRKLRNNDFFQKFHQNTNTTSPAIKQCFIKAILLFQ
jgi:hypothetical protein